MTRGEAVGANVAEYLLRVERLYRKFSFSRRLTWSHRVVHLQGPLLIHLEVTQIADAHIPLNRRHAPSSVRLRLRALCLLVFINPPPRSKVDAVRTCEWVSHQGRLALERPRSDFRRLRANGGVKPSHLEMWSGRGPGDNGSCGPQYTSTEKTFIRFWNGWSYTNGPVVFKGRRSETGWKFNQQGTGSKAWSGGGQ